MPELIYSWEVVVHQQGDPVVLAVIHAFPIEAHVAWLSIVAR